VPVVFTAPQGGPLSTTVPLFPQPLQGPQGSGPQTRTCFVMGIRPVREQLPSPTATAWPAPESSVLRAVPRTISCGELHGELHDTMCWVRAQWNAGATDVRRAETGFGAAQMDCTIENRCRESLVKHKAWQARTHRAESSRHPRKGFSPAHRLPTCCERRSGMIFPTSGLSGGGMSSYAAACGCGRPIRDPRCARGASTSTSRRLRRRRGAAPRQQSVQSCTRWPRTPGATPRASGA